MEIYETITETGDGEWYEWYRVELVTVKTVQAFRFEARNKEQTTYEIRFRPGAYDSPLDKRSFATEGERAEFITQAFERLNLNPSPVTDPRRVEYFLDKVIG